MMSNFRKRNARVKRNIPCPSSSEKKQKVSCGEQKTVENLSIEAIVSNIAHMRAKESRRISQQGLGRPIISAEVQRNRVVAVGNQIFWGKDQKTFISFLGNYIKQLLGPEWGTSEIDKPIEERNLILQWYDILCEHEKKHITTPGEVKAPPIIGAMLTYYGLAYNLYLLQHNVEIQKHLIHRLKQNEHCYAAYYETCVAAWCILSGFTLVLENERDHNVTHCEFTATKNGQSYSVEAKTRQPNKDKLDVGNQLSKALKKRAKHKRIIFIDINVDSTRDEQLICNQVVSSIKSREKMLTINGQPAPPAYLIITNMPYHLQLRAENISRILIAEGFKIPNFGHAAEFHSLIDAYNAREKHADIRTILNAFTTYTVPTTFDGELPELTFGKSERRFIIGNRYELHDGVFATLKQAVVLESEKKARLIYQLEDGKKRQCLTALSDEEISAYKQHPKTFFGVIREVKKHTDNPIDLFEFFYDHYKTTPREKILELFGSYPDIKQIGQLKDDELRLKYAEILALSVINTPS